MLRARWSGGAIARLLDLDLTRVGKIMRDIWEVYYMCGKCNVVAVVEVVVIAVVVVVGVVCDDVDVDVVGVAISCLD